MWLRLACGGTGTYVGVSAENDSGMVPVMMLYDKSSRVSFVSVDSPEGKVLAIVFECKSR